jgi:hypothetical protein
MARARSDRNTKAPFQHGNEVKRLAAGVVGVDLRGQLENAALDLFGCEERRHVARTIT